MSTFGLLSEIIRKIAVEIYSAAEAKGVDIYFEAAHYRLSGARLCTWITR